MATAVFVILLWFTSNVGGERIVDEVDSEKEILDKSRLDLMNLEIEKLKQQVALLTTGQTHKRLVMEMDFEEEITNLKKRLDMKDSEISNLKQQIGSTYTRWGRTVCPGNGTELAYSGFMAGTYHTGSEKGSGANYLCLAGQPTWDHYSDSINNQIVITGVQYEFNPHLSDLADFFGTNIRNDEAPCSARKETQIS